MTPIRLEASVLDVEPVPSMGRVVLSPHWSTASCVGANSAQACLTCSLYSARAEVAQESGLARDRAARSWATPLVSELVIS